MNSGGMFKRSILLNGLCMLPSYRITEFLHISFYNEISIISSNKTIKYNYLIFAQVSKMNTL